MTQEPNVCRHEWQCEGWTVDQRNGECRVCHQQFVFWSAPLNQHRWDGLP